VTPEPGARSLVNEEEKAIFYGCFFIAGAFRHCEPAKRFGKPSFRGDAKHRTRNLEIPGLVLTHHPGMTKNGLLRRCAPRNDGKLSAHLSFGTICAGLSHNATHLRSRLKLWNG
jgi:hypothetical protein